MCETTVASQSKGLMRQKEPRRWTTSTSLYTVTNTGVSMQIIVYVLRKLHMQDKTSSYEILWFHRLKAFKYKKIGNKILISVIFGGIGKNKKSKFYLHSTPYAPTS